MSGRRIRGREFYPETTATIPDDSSNDIKRDVSFNLVVCTKGVEDRWISQNLLCEALLKNIPICAIDGLQSVLASQLNIPRIGALGFKTSIDSPFNDLVTFVVDKIPTIKESDRTDIGAVYLEMNINWKVDKKKKNT